MVIHDTVAKINSPVLLNAELCEFHTPDPNTHDHLSH